MQQYGKSESAKIGRSSPYWTRRSSFGTNSSMASIRSAVGTEPHRSIERSNGTSSLLKRHEGQGIVSHLEVTRSLIAWYASLLIPTQPLAMRPLSFSYMRRI